MTLEAVYLPFIFYAHKIRTTCSLLHNSTDASSSFELLAFSNCCILPSAIIVFSFYLPKINTNFFALRLFLSESNVYMSSRNPTGGCNERQFRCINAANIDIYKLPKLMTGNVLQGMFNKYQVGGCPTFFKPSFQMRIDKKSFQ